MDPCTSSLKHSLLWCCWLFDVMLFTKPIVQNHTPQHAIHWHRRRLWFLAFCSFYSVTWLPVTAYMCLKIGLWRSERGKAQHENLTNGWCDRWFMHGFWLLMWMTQLDFETRKQKNNNLSVSAHVSLQRLRLEIWKKNTFYNRLHFLCSHLTKARQWQPTLLKKSSPKYYPHSPPHWN